MSVYTPDDLMRCKPEAGCRGCAWSETAEIVCRGECIGERDICPWLMACRCLYPGTDPKMNEMRGHRLERLVLQQPPEVQVSPVAISRHRIRLGEYDVRRGRDEEIIRQIAASIADNGLFSPPGGIAAPDGYIDILMGHNRVLAVLSLLDWKTVPVRVFHWWGNDVWDRKVAAFQENALRQQMTFEEEVNLVYDYWRQTGQTVREIARRFRMSKSWVQERIRWGKVVHDDRPLRERAPSSAADEKPVTIHSAPTSAGDLSSLRRQKAARRLTFSAEEVKGWLAQLTQMGVDVDVEASGNLRDCMRQAMIRLAVMNYDTIRDGAADVSTFNLFGPRATDDVGCRQPGAVAVAQTA